MAVEGIALSPRDTLLAQAGVLGIKVDGRWSDETLAEKVLEAQEAAKGAERAAYGEAAKVPVLLLRDAFPLEDEKHLAGETIEVPVPLAKAWIKAGVAERADPLPGE